MLYLSQNGFSSFQTCPRRFQLRYLSGIAWPRLPLSQEVEARLRQGTAFHQLVSLYYAGLNPADHYATVLEPPIDSWWKNFVSDGPLLADTDFVESEKRLTVSVTEQIGIVGRVDLLRVAKAGLFLYDWKTGRPRSKVDLSHDWQTRLYLALVYQLRGRLGVPDLLAEEISITYWYASNPAESVLIRYSADWHVENWAQIRRIAEEIEGLIDHAAPSEEWPLTVTESACLHCPYIRRCGREYVRDTLKEELANLEAPPIDEGEWAFEEDELTPPAGLELDVT